MKPIYYLSALLVFLSACSSQKYSNRKYQQNNNADDAYFSPSDLKKKNNKTKDVDLDQYNSSDAEYYDNNGEETANPNASAHYKSYTQTNNGGNTSYGSANSNALVQNQRPTMNMYNQPNWGPGFYGSPFNPYFSPGMTVSFTTGYGNSWYMGPSYSSFGAGWVYNPWHGWTYNPWMANSWGCYNSFGYSSFRNPYNNYMYDPWTNTWVYDPWGYNPYAYNPYFNPYYNPYWGGGYGYGRGNNGHNRWNNYSGGRQSSQVSNMRRRQAPTFMPAVRNASNNAGGTQIIGTTERRGIAPANGTYTTPSNAASGGTYNNGAISGTAGNTGVGTTPSTPTRNQPDYRNYSNTNNTGTTPGNTNINLNPSIPTTPSSGTPGGSYNYNPNSGGFNGTGSNSNGNSNYTPPANYNTTPPPTQQRYTPPPSNNNSGHDVFSPRNGGSSGGSNSGGSGGGSSPRRR